MPAEVYLATPTIQINGQKRDDLAENVVSILVEETIQGLYRSEVRLSNAALGYSGPEYLFFGQDIVDFGKELNISMGPPDNSAQIFSGTISAIEGLFSQIGEDQVVVLAEDSLQRLRMARHTRTFQNMSDAEAIKQVAGQNGLGADVSLKGPTHKALVQINQSDLAFVRERARHLGGEVWVDKKTLTVKPRSARQSQKLSLAYGDTLFSFRVKADLAQQYSEIGYSGWDVETKEAIDEVAGPGDITGTKEGPTGSSLLTKAFGGRKERVVHAVPLASAEARAYAKARFDEYAQRFVTGTGIADGNPLIKVGTTVTLTGLGGLFNGDYYVVMVRHTFDRAAGYRTTFEVERAYIGRGSNQGD